MSTWIWVLLPLLHCTVIVLSSKEEEAARYLVGQKQIPYNAEELGEPRFMAFSTLSNTTNLQEIVRNILLPRVVGTENHRKVREFIVDYLRSLGWTVDLHRSLADVPQLGKLRLENIIATLNPDAKRYLVLACHYDSKFLPDVVDFLGATDAVVPCAMLLNLAFVLQQQLLPLGLTKVSLMFIFFDGEESFGTPILMNMAYGSRNLVKHWEQLKLLDRIDILVLLDLIGAPDPKFYSFFANTALWYGRLVRIEDRLAKLAALKSFISTGVELDDSNRYFQASTMHDEVIVDDHVPFLMQGVPTLHIIPWPFPKVWHSKHDNASAIDYATTENIARVLRLFTLEYLLPPENASYMDSGNNNF